MTGEGKVLDLMSEVRKDSAGLDLKQLFIGSEGTLGIVSRMNILATRVEGQRSVALLKVRGFEKLREVLHKARGTLGRSLSAAEWFDGVAYWSVLEAFEKQNYFREENELFASHYLLLEVLARESESGALEAFLEGAREDLEDCIVSQNESQFSDLWSLRDSVGPATNKLAKAQLKFDVSVDIAKMDDVLTHVREALRPFEVFVQGYSHFGDSDYCFHLNVGLEDARRHEEVREIVEPYLHKTVVASRGSLSAEHGLGQRKKDLLPLQKGEAEIEFMKKLKFVFDPANILNPGKVFP